MGVIVAVKKRYKFLLLKDVLSLFEINNDNQQLLNKDGSKFRRKSVCVRYGRPVTLLDAANYAKHSWDKFID